jgi:FAD/FMN-containing dehydrogenase
MDIQSALKEIFKGDLDTTPETLDFYSHDASLFELRPEIVAFPKDADDVKAAVSYVLANKAANPKLSITPRSAGTDMSGGAINESIILDVSRHMTNISEVTPESARVQPGRLYREFDIETKKVGSILPSYPASRGLASVGGMVSNNSGGELGIRYGKTQRYVQEISVVLGDGNEYVVRPLTRSELDTKLAQNDYEGELYRRTFELIDEHYDEIQKARPRVAKDSTGYRLWDVWNRETGMFDLTQLFIGAQGTLGIITDIKFKLVPDPMKHVGTLAVYVRNTENLGGITEKIMSYKPFAVEVFDDKTLMLGIKFIFAFLSRMSFSQWVGMCLRLIPNGLALVKGIPKLVLLIEFDGKDQDEVNKRVHEARVGLSEFKNISYMEEANTFKKADKFWKMRQESFNLLRQKVKDKHTAPYIDDFIVPLDKMEELLPGVEAVIKKYNLMGTIAGHLGDGNFHVIPLMKIENPEERAKIEPSMKEVYDIVLRLGGSLSGEHNDGLVRGPWLEAMYGPTILGYMREIKHLYDPQNIFNPKKRTDATWDYSFSKIRQSF